MLFVTPQEKSSLGVFIGKSKLLAMCSHLKGPISLPSVNPVTVVLLKPNNLSCKGHWLINAIQKHCPEVKT